MRLTPEREKEIRGNFCEQSCDCEGIDCGMARNIFAEIDAIRADIDASESSSKVWIDSAEVVIAHLKEENQKLQDEHCRLVLHVENINDLKDELEDARAENYSKDFNEAVEMMGKFRKEREQLKAENEKLKTNQVFEASCTHLFEENVKLKVENEKLKCELKHVTDILDQALAEDDDLGQP